MSHQNPPRRRQCPTRDAAETAPNVRLAPGHTRRLGGVSRDTRAVSTVFAGHTRRLGEKQVPGVACSSYDPVRGRLQDPADDP